MTVQELIDELQKVQDKTLRVLTEYQDSDDDVLRIDVFTDRVEIVPKSMYFPDNDTIVT